MKKQIKWYIKFTALALVPMLIAACLIAHLAIVYIDSTVLSLLFCFIAAVVLAPIFACWIIWLAEHNVI